MGIGFMKCMECGEIFMWTTHQGYAESGKHKKFCSEKQQLVAYDMINRTTLENKDPNREPL